jgi:AraC-like DNA-binding protein
MIAEANLYLKSIELPPAAEWQIDPDCWCLIRIDHGAAYFLFPKHAHDLSPGEVLAVPPHGLGTLRASRINGVRLHCFLFSPAHLSGMLSLAEQWTLDSLSRNRTSEVSHFPATHEISRQFAALREIDGGGNRLLERGIMLVIIAALLGSSLRSSVAPDLIALPVPARFLQLIQTMSEIEMLNMSAAELARRCGCSPRRFGHLFRSHFGMPLRTKRVQMRLQKALHLLSESNAKVASVSRDSGYRSRAAFTVMFRKLFGLNPTELRRLNSQASKHRDLLLPTLHSGLRNDPTQPGTVPPPHNI